MAFGPVQMIVVGFEDPDFKGEILAELDRLRDSQVVRLIDLVAVRKDADGNIEKVQRSDLTEEEAEEFGAIAGALVGFGMEGDEGVEAGAVLGAAAMEGGHVFDDADVWYVADAVPENTAAAIAILEHRWAIGLRDAIRDAGGVLLAESWIHPADLVAVGAMAAEEAED
jgi:uncharacterized membrane protein